MTIVRKIAINKIDGDDANNNQSSEIRPKGEIGIYENLDNGSLELLMFDGVRTNLKSKVLSKGVFYGGNGDSSDGQRRDTIKLIPDTVLYRGPESEDPDSGVFTNDQYLIIDPTGGEPNHIHIRAGGLIDQSTTDLFLGGELNNVRVSDIDDRVTITTDFGVEGETRTWTFDNNGFFRLPGGSRGIIGESEPGVVIFSDTNFGIVTNADSNASKSWIFNNQGVLGLPGNGTIQSEANVSATGTIINVPLNGAGDTVDYVGGASVLEIPKNNDTNQVQAGWIITFTNGGATRTVAEVGDGGNYWSVSYNGDNPALAELTYPLTIQSADYAPASIGNVTIAIDDTNYEFGADGKLKLPTGGDIVDSTGASVLGDLVTISGTYFGESLTLEQDANNSTPSLNEVSGIDFIPTSVLEANDWIGSGTNDPNTYATVTFANGDTRLITGWNTDAFINSGFITFDNSVTLTAEQAWPMIITSYDYTANVTPGKGIIIEGKVWKFDTAGDLILPDGGKISEAIVTSNPTIELTPANPDVASQKLVIKGGGNYNSTENGINLNYYYNTAVVGDTVEIYVYSEANANQTLYWWIHPASANIATPNSGTLTLNESGYGIGPISFVVDSDDYEFTVRVSPTNNVYDSTTIGVESLVFNEAAPTFNDAHHLHLTTGDLSETSIFLGTDNHNVRTTTNGGIQITTPGESINVWEFDATGGLTFPDNTVQTTAYPGTTTVSKNGPTLPTTTGPLASLMHNFGQTGLTDGTYGPFVRGGVQFSILVGDGGISAFTNITADNPVTVNDVLGIIDSGDIGGTPGTTITITVISVVQETPVAIDLTKTINKLSTGHYDLADGVEGQIMYLVRQNNTDSENVFVNVDNGDGANPLRPFITPNMINNLPNGGICTLIFTDGTWKQIGGVWD